MKLLNHVHSPVPGDCLASILGFSLGPSSSPSDPFPPAFPYSLNPQPSLLLLESLPLNLLSSHPLSLGHWHGRESCFFRVLPAAPVLFRQRALRPPPGRRSASGLILLPSPALFFLPETALARMLC